MNNGLKTFLIAGAGLSVYYFTRLKKAANSLIFKAEAVQISKLELLYTTLKIDYSIINPAGVAISVNSFAGSISFKGQQIGTFNSLQPIKIERRSAFKGSFEVRLSNIGAAKTLLSSKGLGEKINFEIFGTLFTPVGTTDFVQNISLK